MAESGSPNLEVLHCRIRNKGGPNWRLYQDVANLTELVPREGRRKSEETGAKTVEWTVDPESLDHQIHIDISRTSSRSPVRQSIAQPSHKQQRQNPRIVQRNTRTQPPLWRVQGFIDFFFFFNKCFSHSLETIDSTNKSSTTQKGLGFLCHPRRPLSIPLVHR